MKANFSNLGRVMVLGLSAVAACAGTKLTDVGDIDGGGAAGSGGATTTNMAGSMGKGGKAATAAGGTGEVGPGGRDDQYVPVEGGYGGEEPGSGFVCEACVLVAETPDIRGIWAASDRIYWVEYGSFDGLGNYEGNGRLMSLAFDAEEPVVVADGLGGPTQLRVTDDYAYVIEERSDSLQGALMLTSISLDSGQVQVRLGLDEAVSPPLNWFRRDFAAVGGSIFWKTSGGMFRLVEGTTAPSQFFKTAEGYLTLLADDSQLYLQHGNGIQAVSVDGDTFTPIWNSAGSASYAPLSLVGDYFYAMVGESDGTDYHTYFARLPKAGGTFKRMAEGGTPWVTRLVTDGTAYVADSGFRAAPEHSADCALTEGQVLDSTATRRLATAPSWRDDNEQYRIDWPAWDANATTVYIGYGDQLYRVARQF